MRQVEISNEEIGALALVLARPVNAVITDAHRQLALALVVKLQNAAPATIVVKGSYREIAERIAFELGYKAHERGENLDAALRRAGL